MKKAYVDFADLAGGEAADFEKVGKVTSASVSKHTGKGWKQWVGILERAGARTWSYQEIVAFLKTKHKLSPWWQQGVALGFEIATDRRKTGQDAKGAYMVTTTKSLPCSEQDMWKVIVSKKGQQVWLKPMIEVSIQPKVQFETSDGFFGEIRTVAQNRRVRLYWQDPTWEKHTVVEVHLVARPKKKSILVFNHTGIQTVKMQAVLRIRWKEAAENLFQMVRTSSKT